MVNCHLAKTEMKFAEIIWDNEPITGGEKLRAQQAEEIKKLIDLYSEEK